MRGRSTSTLSSLLALVLVLRGLFAPGYMPASWSEGPIQLCFQGLPAAAVAALTGSSTSGAPHAHHHAHHHGHASDDSLEAEPENSLESQAFERCSIGEGLSLPALVDAQPSDDPAFAAAAPTPLRAPIPRARVSELPRARGPPIPVETLHN